MKGLVLLFVDPLIINSGLGKQGWLGKNLLKSSCHQQHLPDLVCLLPVCVNLSIVPGVFCD